MTRKQLSRKLYEVAGLERSESAIKNWEQDADSPNRESLNALGMVLGPEIIQAAFPSVSALPWPDPPDDPEDEATARKLGRARRGMAHETPDLVLSASG